MNKKNIIKEWKMNDQKTRKFIRKADGTLEELSQNIKDLKNSWINSIIKYIDAISSKK